MTTRQMKNQPYGVGRFSGGVVTVIIALLVLTGIGLFGYSQQLIHGDYVTGLRNLGTMGGVTWGLYVVIYVYFMGLSFAGITLSILTRLFNWKSLYPITRMAQVMTIIALLMGAIGVVADLGQPGRALINLLRYARPRSPFFGTFTLVVTGYLFASLVYFYLDSRRDAAIMAQRPGRWQGFYRRWAAGYNDTRAERERHELVRFWLAIAILPLLIVATSTLGLVFGLQASRPGWFSALQAPGFVILGSVSGVGMLTIIAAGLRKSFNARGQLNDDLFRTLANIMLVLDAIYIYFMVVEWLSSAYAAHQQEKQLAAALTTGQYAPLFWTTVALLIIPLALLAWQFITKRYNVGLVVISAVLINLAAIGKRYLIVIPSQTHGMLLPYGTGSYSPTWVEYAVVVGLFALGGLLYVLFTKLFPVLELTDGTTS